MMLEAIELRNFKCYEALDLPCAALTVLTGYNAADKSTALQALLLLSQALQTAANESELPLNGDMVSLGSEGDVLRHSAPEPFFSLGVRTAAARILWTFGSQRVQWEGDSCRSAPWRTAHFVGEKAWFSGESESNKQAPERYTFPDPTGPGRLICFWHGKIWSDALRLHFEWPPADPIGRLRVVYIGPHL